MKPIGDYTLNELLDFCKTYYCEECPMNTGWNNGCWAKTATGRYPYEWTMLEEVPRP